MDLDADGWKQGPRQRNKSLFLAGAELEADGAVGSEVAGRLLEQALDKVEAVWTTVEGHTRFVVAQLGVEGEVVMCVDIREVGDDEVYGRVNGVEKVTLAEGDAVDDAVAEGVGLGDGKGFG